MAVNLSSILGALKNGLAAAEQLSPVLSVIPGGAVIKEGIDIAQSLINIANNVKERVEEGKIVASTTDQAELDAILVRLQSVNDQLAEYIAKS